ncbi:small ribosomal subunit Rsm22 family protein [Allokutzneria sp. A3M-2-11 16]|uniref:small ribosomal subunit Rsm22 family protein n=1 Tax=Allokutzneria sp. A3M-2-11 16 TaxID=2962043 RepID=UPI0020B75616|nr:small ribosomal subunit Rsm22 family protein [Allokutzneria sp. A3M-2-11 16]MCP3804403.1 small ribosomal subunit Rsm22 family protein [Allokutzneria sp. A3M-2-11 16]
MALPTDLQSALDTELRRFPNQELSRAVDRLSTRYREGRAATTPIMNSDSDVAAYAGYRMPATYAAVRAVLDEVATFAPEFSPKSHVDVGGGTGTALWAAAGTWSTLTELTVVEQVEKALALGRKLAASAKSPALRSATWRRGVIDPKTPLPAADLVTLSYVLGELPEAMRSRTVAWLAASGAMVVLIEPGTPAGYSRIAEARAQLLDMGRSLVAPCPHEHACPIPRGSDWCHFSARLPRVGAHRLIKEGTLNFEDEKFSYVAASTVPLSRAENRILRHPLKRKGLVSLQLCSNDGALSETTVTKRHGPLYRAARDTTWGSPWPPLS